MNENHVNPMPYSVVERPTNVAQMPEWPGASKAIGLAVYGARQPNPLAVGIDFPDGSSACLEYQTTRTRDTPETVYERIGVPCLAVLVLDRGAGVRVVNGIPTRVAANDAERAIAEIHHLLGKERPLAVLGSGMNERDTRRRYFWGSV